MWRPQVSPLSHPEQFLVLLLQLGLQLPQTLLHIAMAFLRLKNGFNNKKKAFIFSVPRYPSVSLSSILSELMRVWDFDLPLECFVIHPGEGPCWERPKLGPAWGFGCKAFKRMGGHQHQQPGEQAYIYQLTARGQKSCTRRGQWSSTTHTNTTTNTTYNANLPSNHHSSTKDYRHVYVNDDYCLMKQHLIQYFLWY